MIRYTKPHDADFLNVVISNVENNIGYKFPKDYTDLIIGTNGGSFMGDEKYTCFKYHENAWSVILSVNFLYEILRIWDCKCEKRDNSFQIYNENIWPETLMPSELWPFAWANNFNLLTFDMNDGPHPVYITIP